MARLTDRIKSRLVVIEDDVRTKVLDVLVAPEPSEFPTAEAMAADMLTLPSHPWMSTDEVDAVSDAIIDFYR